MSRNPKIETVIIDSKIGPIRVDYNTDNILNVTLNYKTSNKTEQVSNNSEIFNAFSAYFNRKSNHVELPFSVSGTPFEKTVLETILKIPFGETWSYKRLAEESGFSNAFRAVGTVCRKNRLPLIIPCHRVIKSDGSYGNYAYGNELKKQLIDFERKA